MSNGICELNSNRNFLSLNCSEIDRILCECDLANSFIQKIRQPNFFTLVLNLYTREGAKQLLICLSNKSCRLHFYEDKIVNEIKLQRFSQLLRRHIDGAKILEAYQVESNRVVKMLIARSEKKYNLYIRLWSSSPNIFLTTEDDIILDCFYRHPAKGEASNFKLQLPQNKNEDNSKYQLRPFSLNEHPNLPSCLQSKEAPYYKKIAWLAGLQIEESDFAQKKKQALTSLSSLIENLEIKLSELKKKIESASNAESYKEMGELLNANFHLLKPGENSITLNSWGESAFPVTIKLDPALAPRENIEAYFKKYKKAKSSLTYLLEEQQKAATDLKNFERELSYINECNDNEKLNSWLKNNSSLVATKATSQIGTKKLSPTELKKETNALYFNSMGFKLIVGRSGKDNDKLLRYHIRANDTWVHARDYAGAYIFIKEIPGKTIPLEVLLDAANLAMHYSKGKNATHGDLYVTKVKYLRRAKDGPIGLVIPTQEKNLHITIDKNRIAKLLGA